MQECVGVCMGVLCVAHCHIATNTRPVCVHFVKIVPKINFDTHFMWCVYASVCKCVCGCHKNAAHWLLNMPFMVGSRVSVRKREREGERAVKGTWLSTRLELS